MHHIFSGLIDRAFLLLVWLILITWLSLKPMGNPGIEVAGLDKLAHLIFYGGLAFLANHQNVILDNSKLKVWYVILFCFLYGLGIELVQGAIIEGRYFELWDLIANIIGTFIGITVSIIFFK